MTAVLHFFHNPELTLEPTDNLIFSEDLECKQIISHGYEENPIHRVTFAPRDPNTAFLDMAEFSLRRLPEQVAVQRRYRLELHIIPLDDE